MQQSGQPIRAALDAPVAALPSPTMRYYGLFVLMLANSLSILDRHVMTILIEPIRLELGATDTQMGFLTGIAFAAVYVTMCIPAAIIADRWSRKKLIAIAVTVWSVMTILSGTARSFVELFLCRFGVGFGEAGGQSPSNALIGDLFPRHMRATAMSILLFSSPLGLGVGLMWGGWALEHYGWRSVLVMAGIPGLILGPLIWFTFPRVEKGMADGIVSTGKAPPFLQTLKILLSIRTLVLMAFAVTLAALLSTGFSNWLPAFLERSHGLSHATIGARLGSALAVGSLLGVVIGGPLADVMAKRDLRWHFWIPMIATPLAAVVATLALVAPIAFVFPLLGLQMLLLGLVTGPFLAITVTLPPVATRATASACIFVIINAVGLGLGPQVVGILSDVLRSPFGPDSLRLALLIMTTTAIPATLLFYLASRTYRQDTADAGARQRALDG